MMPYPRRKRVKLSEGDVFEFAVPDGRRGYGIIIKRGVLTNGGCPYIGMFRSLHVERPDLNQVVRDEVVLAGWTMDALVYHGRWIVVGHGLPLPLVPFPNFKIGQEGEVYVTDVDGEFLDEATAEERELLDYGFSLAPIGFQDAFEAMHGFRDWRDHYQKLTPAYASARITRPTEQSSLSGSGGSGRSR
jgi:hypothetical protein